jgi:hypothetical protein
MVVLCRISNRKFYIVFVVGGGGALMHFSNFSISFRTQQFTK